MDWNNIFSEFLLGLIGIILTAFGTVIAVLIDKYIKNDQAKSAAASFHDLVRNSVLETYQVYVEELKDKNMFSAEAQKTALSACSELIKANMTPTVEKWLKSNFMNIDEYIVSNIEAQIGALKNSGK